MKLAALALDYDGTIAQSDAPDAGVRGAVLELRRQGIAVLLVTGRRLRELRRVAGDIGFVDAVVAENGAVLELPHIGRHFTLSQPLPPSFVRALRERGIELAVGECIAETDAIHAAAITATIRELELPLVIVFNRGRLMVLHQGVSKATGLHAALRLFRLSEHNLMAIGDAENDHALLDAAELGVAVEWGSPALKARADAILPGPGPSAIPAYVRAAAGDIRLPPAKIGRRAIQFGHTNDGMPAALPIRNRNVLVVGDTRTGKSWLAGLFCEQLIMQRYSLCVIDPEGDYAALEALPGVITLGGHADPPRISEVNLALRHPDLSAVVDLSKVNPWERGPYVDRLLRHLQDFRRQTGLPHRIVLDEAHAYLKCPRSRELIDPLLEGYTLVTFHPSQVDPDIRARCAVVLSTRLTDPDDLRSVYESFGQSAEPQPWIDTLAQLRMGQAALLRDGNERRSTPDVVNLEPRLTEHVRHRRKYVDVPVAEWEAFVFTRDGLPTGQVARTMRDLAAVLRDVPLDVLAGHLARRDLSRWAGTIFGDRTLAEQIGVLERGQAYEASSDVRSALVRVIEDRYLAQDSLL